MAIGWALGAAPGVIIMLGGDGIRGLGFAIIGGTLGLVLALSRVLYQTTSTDTLLRGLLLFCKMTAAKNIPLGDKLIPLEPEEMCGQFEQSANFEMLESRSYNGMRLGWVVAFVPAIWIAINITNRNSPEEHWVLEILKRCIVGFAFVALVGGVCGMAVGAVTVPGIHQRNILLGPLLGALIGAGVGLALAQNAVDPGIFFTGCVLVMAFMGLIGGVFSAENFIAPRLKNPSRRPLPRSTCRSSLRRLVSSVAIGSGVRCSERKRSTRVFGCDSQSFTT